MQIDNEQITRNALALIHSALAELSTTPLSATVRLARLHAVCNVTDHVLGMMTSPSAAFKAEHLRRNNEWRENLQHPHMR